MLIIIMIIFYPRVWRKKIEEDIIVGVTITPGSPQTQRNRVAARR